MANTETLEVKVQAEAVELPKKQVNGIANGAITQAQAQDKSDSLGQVKRESKQLYSNDQPSNNEPFPKAIRYKIQYRNAAGDDVDQAIQYTPWNNLKTTDDDDSPPVFEIVTYVTIRELSIKTSVNTNDEAAAAGGDTAKENLSQKDKSSPSEKEKNLKISAIGYTEMIIQSPSLINALQSKIEYYPGQQLLGTTITVQEPYHVLLHHRKELAQLLNNEEREAQSNQLHDLSDETTIAHVKVLLTFLDAKYKSKIEAEEKRYAKFPPTATFEMMWLLMKPGTKVFTEIDGNLSAFIVHSVKPTTDASDRTTAYTIELWGLDFNGRRIGRMKREVTIQAFDGEREMGNLKVYPISMAPDKEYEQALERLGEFYFQILRSGSAQMDYEGDCLGKKKRFYKGRVVLDPSSYWSHSDTTDDPPLIGTIDSDGVAVDGCACDSCTRARELVKPGKWATYDNIDPKDPNVKLTKEHFLLFPRKIPAFVLKSRKWEFLDIKYAKPFSPIDNAIKNLVMNERNRKMVEVLTHKYKEGQRGVGGAWTADYIQSKGEGQIFLLHGPPGVGKTYTAECIAEHTRRPLIALTCADIGIDEKYMESNLAKWFELAEIWGAVMLIDEADVYLEKRRTGELQRNSLVSAFLRSMEYYRGILFLTTNRIGHIDDAIMSRVHLVLKYDRLDNNARRTIWTQFMDKLEEDGATFTVDRRAKRYLLDISENELTSWNGREIRNAFQTAVALAEYDAKMGNLDQVTLQTKHLEEVINMSMEFKEYLTKWKGDEAARALADKDRQDNPKNFTSQTESQVRSLVRERGSH